MYKIGNKYFMGKIFLYGFGFIIFLMIINNMVDNLVNSLLIEGKLSLK